MTEVVEGVQVFALPHAYWPVVERLLPDSRDVHNLRKTVERLNRRYRYGVIEVQSEEGIGIGVQKRFPRNTVLRVHTTFAQMVEHKSVRLDRRTRYRQERERRSLRLAKHVLTHSDAHADELKEEYPFLTKVGVVPHGVDVTLSCEGSSSPGRDGSNTPRFLVVGTPDRRKGFDRLRAILEAYAHAHGACRCVVISACNDSVKQSFDLLPPFAEGVTVEWRQGLSTDELMSEYATSDVLLHPARYESFGLPFIEAAAAGTPIVTTEVGIAGDLLDGELDRFLVEGDNTAAWATALNDAVVAGEGVGEVLRERYETRYTRDSMVDAYLEYLRTTDLH